MADFIGGTTGAYMRLHGEVDTSEAERFFTHLAKQWPQTVLVIMRKMVTKWQRNEVKHVPISVTPGKGKRRAWLKKNINPVIQHKQDTIYGGITFGTPYAIYLMAGTRKIAKGRVMRWKRGQPPIRHWKAKAQSGKVTPNPKAQMPIGLYFRDRTIKLALEAMRKKII